MSLPFAYTEISHQAAAGITGRGRSYAAATTIRGNVFPSSARLQDRNGGEIVADIKALTDSAVSVGDRITVSGVVYEIKRAAAVSRTGDVQHYESYGVRVQDDPV